MRAVLVFCEGLHDVAFVSRSLGAVASGRWFDKTIGELPAPFGSAGGTGPGCIELQYQRSSLEGLHLVSAARAPNPTFAAMVEVPGGDVATPYFLLNCGGAKQVKGNRALVDNVANLVRGGYLTAPAVEKVAFAFVFDADDGGVEACERGFARDYADGLGGRPISHAGWATGPVGPVGLFVFHDVDDTNRRAGTLEDALAPLVRDRWPARWEAADVYLRGHAEEGDRIHGGRAEYTKARIGITGQFLFPGDSMTEVIGRKGLPEESFKGSVSRALVEFLLAVPWAT